MLVAGHWEGRMERRQKDMGVRKEVTRPCFFLVKTLSEIWINKFNFLGIEAPRTIKKKLFIVDMENPK